MSRWAFSPLHSEGGIGTQVAETAYVGPNAAFSPLHSEGGIGTFFDNKQDARVDKPFSPLHSEGGIGTARSWRGFVIR